MTRNILSFIFVSACMLYQASTSLGAEICVSTPVGLQNAFFQADQNNEDDLIKVQQGTYTGYDFYSPFYKEHNVTLQGGYTAGCASRVLNPANTIIDGGNVRRGLMLISYGGGNLTVDGFTIRNGKTPSTGDGAGLYLVSDDATQSGDITVTHNIISSNAAENAGGGIYAKSQSNPSGTAGAVTISNNTVTNNQALGETYASGGGIYAESYSFDGLSGPITIDDNTVTGNESTYAGGIWAMSYGPLGPGNVAITDNLVEGNTATGGNAGGIYADSHAVTANSGTVTISRNTVLNNATSGGNNLGKGGGVYAETNCADSGNGGEVLVAENTIGGNSARMGGGIYASTTSFTQNGGDVRLSGNIITGNTTERDAGGVWVIAHSGSGTAGDIIFTNNVIAGNRTGEYYSGGGAWLRSWSSGTGTPGSMTFTNNTITANRANVGDGFYVILENNIVGFYNNVIRDNKNPLGWDVDMSGTGTTSAYNNNFGSVYGTWTNSGSNINLNPEFKNPGSWNDNATPADLFDDLWLGGDFHLQSDSPCVDSGLNGASELPVYDFEGAPRISDGNSDGSAVVDIGADEFIRRSISTPGTSLLLLFQ